jgi:predicted nucleic acid-binding protein
MASARHAYLVIDASAVVALLADAGPAGDWAELTIRGASLVAPDLMPFEVSNILRRHEQAGALDSTAAALAHADLVAMPVDLYPFTALSRRIWELRRDLATCHAAYVALAELLSAPLATLDARLARAAGPRCTILCFAP